MRTLLIEDDKLIGDGLEILREWREKRRAEPVQILTAREAQAQRLEGLRLGADDYLCKPFTLIEVAALDGEILVLKPKEFALLELLMRNAGRVLPRKLIEEKLYTWDDDVSSNHPQGGFCVMVSW